LLAHRRVNRLLKIMEVETTMTCLYAGCKFDKENCKNNNYCLAEKVLEYLHTMEQMWIEAEKREWVVP
jgi:hypothetical protein